MDKIFCITNPGKTFDVFIMADSAERAMEIARNDVDLHDENNLITTEVQNIDMSRFGLDSDRGFGFIDEDDICSKLREQLTKPIEEE